MTMLTRILTRFGLCVAGGLALCLLLHLRGWHLLLGIGVGLFLYAGKPFVIFMGELIGAVGRGAFLCLLFKSWIGILVVLFLLAPALIIVFFAAAVFGAVRLAKNLWQACHGDTDDGAPPMDLWGS